MRLTGLSKARCFESKTHGAAVGARVAATPQHAIGFTPYHLAAAEQAALKAAYVRHHRMSKRRQPFHELARQSGFQRHRASGRRGCNAKSRLV